MLLRMPGSPEPCNWLIQARAAGGCDAGECAAGPGTAERSALAELCSGGSEQDVVQSSRGAPRGAAHALAHPRHRSRWVPPRVRPQILQTARRLIHPCATAAALTSTHVQESNCFLARLWSREVGGGDTCAGLSRREMLLPTSNHSNKKEGHKKCVRGHEI